MRLRRLFWGLFLIVLFIPHFSLDAVEIIYAPYNETDSALSGSVVSDVSFIDVDGNEDSSFYDEGWDYVLQANVSYRRYIGDNELETDFMIQKTDADYIDARNDVRLKQITAVLYGKGYTASFGEYYQFFSDYTLTNTLEGLGLDFELENNRDAVLVFGRSQRASSVESEYDRYVFGARYGSDFMAFNIVSSQDNSASLGDANAEDLDNTVLSLNGKLNVNDKLCALYEVAYSSTVEDRSVVDYDRDWGWAISINPRYAFERGMFSYKYERVEPRFFTAQGSSISDEVLHQWTLDYAFDSFSISLLQQYDYDNLQGSDKSYRTKNLRNEFSLTKDYGEISVRPYTSLIITNSSDMQNTQEAEDLTIGISSSYEIDGGKMLNLGYERRMYNRESDESLSEYSHRLNLGIGGNFLEDANLYLQLDSDLYIRNPKSSQKEDIDIGLSLLGKWQFSDSLTFNFGMNLTELNSSIVNSDSSQKRTYIECDYRLPIENNPHVILSVEENDYSYQDSVNDYTEKIGRMRIVMSF